MTAQTGRNHNKQHESADEGDQGPTGILVGLMSLRKHVLDSRYRKQASSEGKHPKLPDLTLVTQEVLRNYGRAHYRYCKRNRKKQPAGSR